MAYITLCAPGQSNQTMISRQRAEEIAIQTMRELGLGKKVSGVFTFDEIPYSKPNTYNLAIEDCWIAYIEKEFFGLESSTIVVIRQDTGQVIYYVSAGDEG